MLLPLLLSAICFVALSSPVPPGAELGVAYDNEFPAPPMQDNQEPSPEQRIHMNFFYRDVSADPLNPATAAVTKASAVTVGESEMAVMEHDKVGLSGAVPKAAPYRIVDQPNLVYGGDPTKDHPAMKGNWAETQTVVKDDGNYWHHRGPMTGNYNEDPKRPEIPKNAPVQPGSLYTSRAFPVPDPMVRKVESKFVLRPTGTIGQMEGKNGLFQNGAPQMPENDTPVGNILEPSGNATRLFTERRDALSIPEDDKPEPVTDHVDCPPLGQPSQTMTEIRPEYIKNEFSQATPSPVVDEHNFPGLKHVKYIGP